jgi:hypothetical protein
MKECELRGMNIPKKLSTEWETLKRDYLPFSRRFEKKDQGATSVIVVRVLTKGNRPRESFAGYLLYVADVGTVWDTFAEIWIRREIRGNEPVNKPVRFRIDSGKYFVFC